MAAKQMKFDTDARAEIAAGLSQLARAVKATLEKDPPYGATVTFEGDKASGGWDAPPLAPWLDKATQAASETYFGKPALKVNGEMMVCLPSHKSAEADSLVVRVDFLERDLRIAHEPAVYYVKPHYIGYPCVLTRLSKVSDSALKDLLESAHQYVAKKKSQGRKRARSH